MLIFNFFKLLSHDPGASQLESYPVECPFCSVILPIAHKQIELGQYRVFWDMRRRIGIDLWRRQTGIELTDGYI